MARHVFFGANTPRGFVQWFDQILFLDEAQRMIFIKGSSGSGKSTLMRRAGEAFEAQGQDVEYIHCTNNVADLDGVCIRGMGIAFLDATPPHAIDPILPVAVGEIFNTADRIDREALQLHTEELRQLQVQKQGSFEKAYRYFNAACEVFSNSALLYQSLLKEGELNRAVARELKQFAGIGIAAQPGRNRRLFATAVTPQGKINFIDTLTAGCEVVALRAVEGMGADRFLARMREEANARGLDTEGCYSPLDTDRLEHLLIPAIGRCYTTVNEHHTTNDQPVLEIDFMDFLDRGPLKARAGELLYNEKMFDELLQRAMDSMAEQKVLHDRAEILYAGCMDFERLGQDFDALLDRLLPARREKGEERP
ncbi:MAG: hypothetical protein GXX99_08385 [Clostridiales bacterium]|nr:hypothetical protein [Clostridiales bacterium]